MKKSLNLRVLARAGLGIIGGVVGWWYGYYWAGRMYAFILGYDPFFEYSLMQFASSIAGGVAGSLLCGLILWHKKSFPVVVAILATLVVVGQLVLQSRYGYSVNFFALVLGFSVVPLLVNLLDRRESKAAKFPDI